MRTRVLAGVCVLVGGVGLMARADDKPLDRVEVDKRVARIVYDSAALGTEMYNKDKNYEGCFRLYQGTLMAVHPMLDHRPKLADFVRDQLAKAKGLRPEEGAFVLREALDAVQAQTAQSLLPPKKPLWERLGGEKAVRTVVKDFVDAAVADRKLNITRGGKFFAGKDAEKLEQALVEAISQGTGGPVKPTGPDLKTVLAGTKITDNEFLSLSFHLVLAMQKQKVPDEERRELLDVLRKLQPQIVGQ